MKKTIAILISLLMAFSYFNIAYIANALGEYTETVIDYDQKPATTIAYSNNASFEVVDFNEEKAVRFTCNANYEAIKIKLPADWKADNLIGIKFKVTASDEGTRGISVNRQSTGLARYENWSYPIISGAKAYDLGAIETDADFTIATGETFEFVFDLTAVDFSQFPEATYLSFGKNPCDGAVGYIQKIQFVYQENCQHENKVFVKTVAATCDEGAYDEYTCPDCNETVKVYDELNPALGHNWVATGTVVEATASQPGYTEYECSRCHETKQDDFVYLKAKTYKYVAATNQIADDGDPYTVYNSITVPSGDVTYNNETAAKANIPWVSDATWSKNVGTFYDASAGHCITAGRPSGYAAGDFVQFTFSLEEGIYSFYTYARSHQSRAAAQVSVATEGADAQIISTNYKQDKSGDTGAALSRNDIGYLVVTGDTDVDVKFTVTSGGQMFFKAFIFESLDAVPDGETATYVGPAAATPSYSISIDGVEVDTADEGDSFELPASNANGFIGYFDGVNRYKAGDSVVVTDDLELTTVAVDSAEMLEGASLRIGARNGIRFITEVNASAISQTTDAGYTVQMGTLIAPVNLLGANALTFDVDNGNYIDVPTTGYYEDNQIAGSIIVNLNKNITRDFIGRGYVKVFDGDELVATYYAEQSDNARSLKTLANAWINDIESYSFSYLNDAQKAMVTEWANA